MQMFHSWRPLCGRQLNSIVNNYLDFMSEPAAESIVNSPCLPVCICCLIYNLVFKKLDPLADRLVMWNKKRLMAFLSFVGMSFHN